MGLAGRSGKPLGYGICKEGREKGVYVGCGGSCVCSNNAFFSFHFMQVLLARRKLRYSMIYKL